MHDVVHGLWPNNMLNPAAARRTWRRDDGRLVDNPASRVDDRLMQPGSDLNSNFDGRIGLSSGKSKADVIKAKGIFFPGGLRGAAFKSLAFLTAGFSFGEGC